MAQQQNNNDTAECGASLSFGLAFGTGFFGVMVAGLFMNDYTQIHSGYDYSPVDLSSHAQSVASSMGYQSGTTAISISQKQAFKIQYNSYDSFYHDCTGKWPSWPDAWTYDSSTSTYSHKPFRDLSHYLVDPQKAMNMNASKIDKIHCFNTQYQEKINAYYYQKIHPEMKQLRNWSIGLGSAFLVCCIATCFFLWKVKTHADQQNRIETTPNDQDDKMFSR